MSYIGASPTTAAFLTDQFSANGSGTVFTLSTAPANTNSILVAVSGVLQDPSTYSVSGTSLTFSAAPPAGTGNISVRFLGIPASGVTTTAYRTQTEVTATAGQTTFTPPSYTVGFIDVYRNGVLLGSADFTASNGTTVVLAAGATAGDLIETISFSVSSVLNAIPATAGAVNSTYLLDGSVTKAKMGSGSTWAPAGTVVQVVEGTSSTENFTTSASYVSTNLSASITPTSASSRILVIVSSTLYSSSASWGVIATVYRGGSDIASSTSAGVLFYGDAAGWAKCATTILDSPASASSLTYQLFLKSQNSGTNVGANRNSTRNSIVLMEIAA